MTPLTRCCNCNCPYDPASGPCWHCDAGLASKSHEKVTLVAGQEPLRLCPQCRYDLSGNTGVADCPECGYDMPVGWTQHRMVLNRCAATLKAGPVTSKRLLEIGIGASAITLVLFTLRGFRPMHDGLWYGSTADRLISFLTVFTMMAALAAILLWCSTLLVTLGRWRHEKQVEPRLDQPAIRCRRSFLFRMACRAATVLLILYFVLSGLA